jgi:hypothetical protein
MISDPQAQGSTADEVSKRRKDTARLLSSGAYAPLFAQCPCAMSAGICVLKDY